MFFDYPTNGSELILNYSIICVFSFFLSVYVFCKSQSIKLSKIKVLYLILSAVLLTVLFVYVRFINPPFAYLLRFILIPLILSYLIEDNKQFFKSLAIGLISIVFVTILRPIAFIIQAVILWIFKLVPADVFVYLPGEIITIILCVLFMNIKRFRRGLQFFQNENNLGLGLAISGVVIILKCLNLRDNQEMNYMFIVFIIGIIIAGFGLYLWIRRSITAHYRERLQLKSEEHYKELLEKRDKEIEKQRQSNEYLAKIVHRDNHLMNSLNTAIDAYQNADDNAEKSDLFHEIQTMIKERGALIDREQRETKLLPSTGSLLIDSTINDLFIKAAAHGIDFDMAASAPVSEIIGKYISQTDLQTLLSDHIKDAVIAVEARGEGSGKILLDLSMQNDNYCITIYDNGVAFEPDTLSKLGMERVTTHAESGGSGIGFMTTFETLKKAYASLILTEFDCTMPFTKSVAFRFDGESSFIIQSHRSVELKEKLTRDDVVIL